MNDNFNYEEEIVEETQDDTVKEKKGGEKVLKIVLGAVIVALIVVVVLVSLLLGTGAGKDDETTLPEETTISAGTEEITTSAAEKYKAGQYTVNVGENGRLNLRKEASKDAEQLITVPNGQLLTVTEVIYDATAEEGSQYWGKSSYLGWEGYVAMVYLANAYSSSIVTPGEVTTAETEATTGAAEETTTAASTETTTKKPNETTTAASTSEATTAKPAETTTTANSSVTGATTPGKYTVDAQPYLNMRDDHNVGALAIAQIPDKETVTVVEVYHDSKSTDKYTQYWGKITYAGITGWVAMGYLE